MKAKLREKLDLMNLKVYMPKANRKHLQKQIKKGERILRNKESNPKMSDEIIAKKLGISRETLRMWKKKFATT